MCGMVGWVEVIFDAYGYTYKCACLWPRVLIVNLGKAIYTVAPCTTVHYGADGKDNDPLSLRRLTKMCGISDYNPCLLKVEILLFNNGTAKRTALSRKEVHAILLISPNWYITSMEFDLLHWYLQCGYDNVCYDTAVRLILRTLSVRLIRFGYRRDGRFDGNTKPTSLIDWISVLWMSVVKVLTTAQLARCNG